MAKLVFSASDEVHIYLASLSDLVNKDWLNKAELLLNDQEQARFNNIKESRRRQEFLFGRYVTKSILSGYLHIPAAAICIQPDNYGKPRLVGNNHIQGLGFNVSHSADYFALAICQQGEVGVDIEIIKPQILPDIDTIAKHHFSVSEHDLLMNSSQDERLEHFFRMWTLKESVLKTIGLGLSCPLSSVVVNEKSEIYHFDFSDAIYNINRVSGQHWADKIPGYHLAVAKVGSLGNIKMTLLNTLDFTVCSK